jgi:hypothetical protein
MQQNIEQRNRPVLAGLSGTDGRPSIAVTIFKVLIALFYFD